MGLVIERVTKITKARKINNAIAIITEKIILNLLNKEGELEFKAYFPSQNLQPDHPPKNFKLGEGIAGVSANEKRIIYIPDTSISPEFVSPSQHFGSPKGLICIPLLDDQEIFGVMNFSGKVSHVTFDEADQKFAQTIARMTVVTTKNIQMLAKIAAHSLVNFQWA